MEQYLASLKRFFYDLWPVKIYDQKVPAEIEIPSIYYSLPDETDRLYTKTSYETFQVLRVSVFNSTDELTFLKAHELSESIRKNKYRIPLVLSNGTLTADFIEVESISCNLVNDLEARIIITFSILGDYN